MCTARAGPLFPFPLVLPAPGNGPRLQSLHQQLKAAILDGRLPAGSPLPSTREVARLLALGRNTVVAAYDLLLAEGYVQARDRARAVVADLGHRVRHVAVPAALPQPRARDSRLHPHWQHAAPHEQPREALPVRSFRLGVPEHAGFPHAVWRRLWAHALRQWSRQGFSYPPSQGLEALRVAIAGHVAYTRAVVCTPASVLITSGAQQAFDLLARVLIRPGRETVAIEEPGYPPLRTALLAAGARLRPVPVDSAGLCVDQLPDEARLICVTPSHQSPTGVALSMPRRLALLEFARRHDALILEDDYDGEFRFGVRPLDALQTLDAEQRVFYVGTFSKSLFPALRKGYIVAPDWAMGALITAKHAADAHCDVVGQAVLARFIAEGHLARHVRRLRQIYAERRDILLAGLQTLLSPWLAPIPAEAGLHLSALLRDPDSAATLFRLARKHLPGAQDTREYALVPANAFPALTIGYGVIEAEAILPALRALQAALRARLPG